MKSRFPESQWDAGARASAGGDAAAVTCPRCGTRFGCGVSAPGCWCEALPPLAEPASGRGCYCPACLRTLSAPGQSGAGSGMPPATST